MNYRALSLFLFYCENHFETLKIRSSRNCLNQAWTVNQNHNTEWYWFSHTLNQISIKLVDSLILTMTLKPKLKPATLNLLSFSKKFQRIWVECGLLSECANFVEIFTRIFKNYNLFTSFLILILDTTQLPE